jgi:LysM repeat protein
MAVPPTVRRSLRFAVVGAPFLLVATLSACGGDDDASGPNVLIQPSTFTTQLTQTTAAGGAEGGGGPAGGAGTATGTQVYEVQAGDFLGGIADDYGIPPESIANFNNWDDGTAHVIHPGQSIKIPPGAEIPDQDEESDEEDEATTEQDEEEDDEDSGSPDDEPRCADGSLQGTYEIQEDDTTRAGVAESLDVTVAQLDETNRNTPGYSMFYPGLEILVPCGDDTDG